MSRYESYCQRVLYPLLFYQKRLFLNLLFHYRKESKLKIFNITRICNVLNYFLSACILFFLAVLPLAVFGQSADRVYSLHRDSVFQIRIVEINSGSQAMLGSGFVVNDGNLIATNYHVVSSKVLSPEKYRIEIEIAGKQHEFEVLDLDVVADLALLKPAQINDDSDSESIEMGLAFQLAKSDTKKGEKVYSLGNPHDIGMTVVEGNYNGYVEDRFLPQIHFSGAINSGMSGGPAVNAAAEVVGINVATGGNQIGFLVPVQKLQELISRNLNESDNEVDLIVRMGKQIEDTTTKMVESLLQADWPKQTIGNANAPAKIVDWVECWGNSKKENKSKIQEISRGCNNGSRVYIDSGFNTGHIEYEYYYVITPDWPAASLYRYMTNQTSHALPGNSARKKDVSNYKCLNKQVALTSRINQRINFCTRRYKRFEQLYDVFFIGVSNDREDQVLMQHFTLAGVTEEISLAFLKKFMEQVSWQ